MKKTIQTILYWVISWTWGLPMTLIGAIGGLLCMVMRHRPCHYKQAIYFQAFGKNWGGMEAGCFFFVDENTTKHTCQHEWGHSLQNLVLGPFMPFVVCLPSASRYWLRNFSTQKGKKIYSIVLTVVLLTIVGGLFLWAYLAVSTVLFIISYVLMVYVIALGFWLLVIETPRYKDGKNPAYDFVWFEGMATKLGEKYYKEGDYVKQNVYFSSKNESKNN